MQWTRPGGPVGGASRVLALEQSRGLAESRGAQSSPEGPTLTGLKVSNKKLLETSASLLVTSALLVVTRSCSQATNQVFF